MKRALKIWAIVLSSLILFFAVAGSGVWYISVKYPTLYHKIVSIFIDKERNTGGDSTSKIKNDTYDLHRQAAKKSGLKIIKNDTQLNNYVKEGKLVKVTDGQGYKIAKLTHSKAVLTIEAEKTLQEIGSLFSRKAGSGNYFVVSSLTRTVADQKKLTKSNINATKNTSTHSYGCTFDISYIRFNGKKGNNAKLKSDLESILIDYQKDKKIYIIVEKKIHCYHITVRPEK